MVKSMEETVTDMLYMEGKITVTLSKLGLATYNWKECLDELHVMNRELRLVGVALDVRKSQVINYSDEMDSLMHQSNTRDIKNKRTAIGGLMDEQTETLDEVQECIAKLENNWRKYDDEKAGDLREDMEQLNKTVVDIEKPISDLKLKYNINRMGADPAYFDKFMISQLEYFKMAERLTFQREITYCRGIFFDALKKGQIDEIVFKDLISRFPKELQVVIRKSRITFRQYQTLLTQGRMRKTYGPMTELSVKNFLRDLEKQAHERMRSRIERMICIYGYGNPEVTPRNVEAPVALSSFRYSSDESKFSEVPPVRKNVRRNI